MADPHRAHVAPLDPASVSGVVGESPSTPATVDPSLRVSVLMVGQRFLTAQRRGRYVAGSGAHPARMAPDLAQADEEAQRTSAQLPRDARRPLGSPGRPVGFLLGWLGGQARSGAA